MLTGGGAYALDGHNTVFSDDIVNGEVRSADVADDTTSNALKGVDIAPDVLKGRDIKESSLQGLAEGDSVAGYTAREPGDPTSDIATIPDVGKFTLDCTAPSGSETKAIVSFVDDDDSADVELWREPDSKTLIPNGSGPTTVVTQSDLTGSNGPEVRFDPIEVVKVPAGPFANLQLAVQAETNVSPSSLDLCQARMVGISAKP